MSIFDIEEQPITEKGLLELGFVIKLFPSRYVKEYRMKEENISISYLISLQPHGDSWKADLSVTYFGFRMKCTSINPAYRTFYRVFVSNNDTIWSSLDMHEDWTIPHMVTEVKTLNDLIILTSSNAIKQHCKEFITSDKVLW